jgi:hypothetical protein
MAIYYILHNRQYYNKLHGWVDHKKFADKLTRSEAIALTRIYENSKITT